MKSPRRRGCAGKRKHPNPASAQSVIEQLVAGGARRDSLNVYRCRHCRSYHVGHTPGSNSSR